jgi:hypothetical protein
MARDREVARGEGDDEEPLHEPLVEGAPVGPGAGVVGSSGAFVGPTSPLPGTAADDAPDPAERPSRGD